MNNNQALPADVSALIDADWPEWQSALEDIRREYGDEGVVRGGYLPEPIVGDGPRVNLL